MEIPTSLQTIAEISIAFAGFSGLIVALRKNTGPLTKVHIFRLQILLTLAFGAMFLSLLPETLHYFGVQVENIWILASSVLSAYSVVFLIWWVIMSRRMIRTVPEIFNWFAFSFMTVGHTLIVLLQVSVIFSLLENVGEGAYVTALVWYLIHAAHQFARMLFVQPKGGRAETS